MSGFSVGAALFTAAILGIIINTTFGATFNPIHSKEFKEKAAKETARLKEENRLKSGGGYSYANAQSLDPSAVEYILKMGSSAVGDPATLEQIRKWGTATNINH